MFADLYHLTLRNHPSHHLTGSSHDEEASFALLSRPLNDPLTVRLSLHPDIPGSIFLSSSSRRHLSRGEDRKRIFEERIIG